MTPIPGCLRRVLCCSCSQNSEKAGLDPVANRVQLIAPKSMNWKPRKFSPAAAYNKMRKNSEKGIVEAQKRQPVPTNLGMSSFDLEAKEEPARPSPSFATLEEVAVPTYEESLKKKQPLWFSYERIDSQGNSHKPMQDAHACFPMARGIVAAVADGHGPGGENVSLSIIKEVIKNFGSYLFAYSNVHTAMEQFVASLSQKIRSDSCGSTLILSFITETGTVYTATIGDSEAFAYRNINGALKSIPLSCVRDWSSPKDALRAAIALKDQNIATEWPKHPAKSHRFNNEINISRSIGDLRYSPAISPKPKITVHQVKTGDLLIFASDGLWDFVTQEEIIAEINKSPDGLYRHRPETLNVDSARQSTIEAKRSDRGIPFPCGKGDEEDRLGEVAASPNSKFQADGGIAKRLVKCATENRGNSDHVTVIAVHIKKVLPG